MKANLTVLILTYNESFHIERCIKSVNSISNDIIIIDSFSTDDTLEKARKLGARIYQNPFVNQAVQFQWALDNCPVHTNWVMRLDADEYVTKELATEINFRLSALNENITGIFLKRQVHFMDRWIKHGGYYPIILMRIWRNGLASIEQRWMDEHIKLSYGVKVQFDYDIVDDNLNNLTWWIDKHNKYATREAVDILNTKYNLFEEENSIAANVKSDQQNEKKRWLKSNLYQRLPLFFRAFLYFIFRYFFQFGFLDGKPGLIWHFLQGFWYRFLVDAKINQIEYISRTKNKTITQVLLEDFEFKI